MLNAGKNKLRSMDEVRSLVSLRALILNGKFLGSWQYQLDVLLINGCEVDMC